MFCIVSEVSALSGAYCILCQDIVCLFFATAVLGESTAVKDIKEFIEESPRYKDKIDDAELDGKQVIYLRLEYEHDCIVELLKKINEDTGGNKFEVIYED